MQTLLNKKPVTRPRQNKQWILLFGRLGRLATSLGMLAVLFAHNSVAEPIAVITNEKVKESSLSTAKLRSIFGMRTNYWKNGQAIRIFVLEDNNPLHVHFSKDLLHTYPYNLRRIWERRVYSGTGRAPTIVNSEQEMIELVSQTKNAIGYIRHKNIESNVKVLEIR